MRLLLDTQIALWWLVGSPKLKRAMRERLAASECAVSVASIWEVAVKHRIGKLSVAPDVFARAMRAAGAFILPVTDVHAAAYAQLPDGHSDPFDLLLAAVARAEKLCLITADVALSRFAATVGDLVVEAWT